MISGGEGTARGGEGLLGRLRQDARRNPRKSVLLVILLPALFAVWVPLLRGGASSKAVEPSGSAAMNPVVGTTPSADSAGQVVDPGSHEPMAFDGLERRLEIMRSDWEPRWKVVEGETPFGAPKTLGAEGQLGAFLGNRPGEEAQPEVPPDENPAAKAERSAASELAPTGIYLSRKHGNLARLAGVLRRVDDQVGVFRVEKITERRVVLRGHYGAYVLMLKEGGER